VKNSEVFSKQRKDVDAHQPNYNAYANTTGYAGLMDRHCVFTVTYVRLIVLVVLGWCSMRNRKAQNDLFQRTTIVCSKKIYKDEKHNDELITLHNTHTT